MESFIVVVVIVVISIFVYLLRKRFENEGVSNVSPSDEIVKVNESGFIKKILQFKEARSVIAACVVIYFASIMLPSKIEIRMTHDIPRRDITINIPRRDITINHDFGGNMHKPINLQFSDPGYPIKFEVSSK